MCAYQLITPDMNIINYYYSLWNGENVDYETRLFINHNAISIDSLIYSNGNVREHINNDREITSLIRDSRYDEAIRKINAVYSTRLPQSLQNVQTLLNGEPIETLIDRIYRVRETINNYELENSLNERARIIHTIANGVNGSNRYSFATKFCSFLAPDLFPIYDSISSTLIHTYLGEGYHNIHPRISKKSLGSYYNYISAYDLFIESYNLGPTLNSNNGNTCYKKIDKFLWLYGKAISKHWKNEGILKFSSSDYIPPQ